MKPSENLVDRIAIVDPCFDDYDPLLTSFDAQAWSVELCATGEEALRVTGADALALWFVNVRLSDMAGATLLKLIRRRQRWTSVILVGDCYSEADELAARTAGATAYLCKPVTAHWAAYLHPSRRHAKPASGHRLRASPTMRPP